MADLIVLNGPPASGKSTLAAAFVTRRPLALNLDIDVIRGQLGASIDHAHEAGIAARRLAIAMADEHLSQGLDVIVPQFLLRAALLDDLAEVAARQGAWFVEIALRIDRTASARQFAQRSASPNEQSHRDAAELVERAGGLHALASMHDDYDRFIASRGGARIVEVVVGDVGATLTRIEACLRDG